MPVTPTTSDVVFWVICGIAALIILVKAWPWISRGVGIGNAVSGLPELTEQVGLLATSFEEFAAEAATFVDKVNRIEDQVANTHAVNLRDDMDAKHRESMDAISEIRTNLADVVERQNAGAQLIAGVIERQNDGEKAIVRLRERIDGHHRPQEG